MRRDRGNVQRAAGGAGSAGGDAMVRVDAEVGHWDVDVHYDEIVIP